ncbi:Cytochrome c oxidase copper chaperone [Acarospora aff. strigata]|nr:Cytochrome c oxidase copper chaperone [Acarospora aff. strigata]
MSSQAVSTVPSTPATAGNLGSELKPAGSASAQVKDEKAARDECMLFSNSDNAQEECQSMVDKYRSCMAGYGFKIA